MLDVQTPARGSFVLSSLGCVFEVFFFRAAADVFFRARAASVETCECRARLTGGRDGCRRFARRPYNTPVRASCRLSRGICCAAPHGERCSATVHAVSSCVLARVRTAAAASGAYCCFGVGARRLQLASAAFFRAALLPEASCPTVCTQSSGKVLPRPHNELASRHTRFWSLWTRGLSLPGAPPTSPSIATYNGAKQGGPTDAIDATQAQLHAIAATRQD